MTWARWVIAAVLAGSLGTRPTPTTAEEPKMLNTQMIRAMWVWNTREIMINKNAANLFLNSLRASGATDVYLYLTAKDFKATPGQIKTLVNQLKQSNVRAWAMEGWRGYFSDVGGPAGLYAAVDAVVAFNKVNTNDFYGFHSDMEPQDGQGDGAELFHNNITSSKLSPDQKADRDRLMADWLSIHRELRERTKAGGLKYGGAMPSWADDYMGEAIPATLNGVTKPVVEHLMELVDQYAIMAYNVQPVSVIDRCLGELKLADTMATPPQIVIGIETHVGAGKNITYADSPPKNNKAAVINDLAAIVNGVSKFKSFAGTGIHDWVGWRDLPTKETDAAAPHAPTSPKITPSGWNMRQ